MMNVRELPFTGGGARAAPVGSLPADTGSPAAQFVVVPGRMALLNIDMQNCFVEGYPMSAPDSLEVLSKINRLASVCRDAGVLVIHTAHVLRADGSNAGVMREFIPAIRAGMINRGSHATALHRDLVIGPQDIILEKPRFGAFEGTDLDLILRAHDIDSVIVSGIATNICCETTAREAAMRDFRLFFLSDATATFDLAGISHEQIQKTVCATLTLFGQVLTADRMLDAITLAATRDGARSAASPLFTKGENV
jgi:nicotinamidase-related amidase